MQHVKDIISSYGPATKYDTDWNQCAVTALSASFEISYDEAHAAAQQYWNRQHKKGTKSSQLFKTFKPKSVSTFLGRTLTPVETTRPYWCPRNGKRMRKMKVKSFSQQYPTGTYYVIVARHALVVKDGVIVDNRRDSATRNVLHAWRVG